MAAPQAIDYTTPVPSAQVKTCILLAGLQTEGTTTVREAVRTRDHSELALRAFGATVERSLDSVSIRGPQRLHAIEAAVPGDLSSAAFFLCAAALFPGSNLVLNGLGMNPTRAALLDVLTALGARIWVLNLEEKNAELVGTVRISAPAEGLGSTTINGALAAQLIDELPVLAAIGPFTSGGIRIRDARELRVKESDRIALVVKNLRAMGAEVEEFEDGLDVPGGQHCTARPSTPAAITASPWPSAWRRCAPRERRGFRARKQLRSAFRSSSICWIWWPSDKKNEISVRIRRLVQR